MPPSVRDFGGEVGDRTPREMLQQWLITGAALTIPALVTLVILGFVLNFVSSTLDPLVGVAENTGVGNRSDVFIKVFAVVLLLGVVLVVGILAEHTPTDGDVALRFHRAMESVPGVGSVYKGFRQMSEVVVESDADSFRDVKLVEFPTEGSYTLAFVTADTPGHLEEATGRGDMVTVFMPMAPNPVMGGHVLHVDRDRVVDVDLTVEEGIQSIVTSGVTVGGEDRSASLSAEEIAAIGREGGVRQFDDRDDEQVYEPRQVAPERERERHYDEAVDAVHADTPEGIIERERRRDGDGDGETDPRPEKVSRDPEERESTEQDPAEAAGAGDGESGDDGQTPAELADRPAEEREATERRPAESGNGNGNGEERD